MKSEERLEPEELLEKAKNWPLEEQLALYCIIGSVAEERGLDASGLAESMCGKSKGVYKRVIREIRKRQSEPGYCDAAVAWCRQNFLETDNRQPIHTTDNPSQNRT